MYVLVKSSGALTFRYDYRMSCRREIVMLGQYGPLPSVAAVDNQALRLRARDHRSRPARTSWPSAEADEPSNPIKRRWQKGRCRCCDRISTFCGRDKVVGGGSDSFTIGKP